MGCFLQISWKIKPNNNNNAHQEQQQPQQQQRTRKEELRISASDLASWYSNASRILFYIIELYSYAPFLYIVPR